MPSVTQRIKEIKQPKEGFVKLEYFRMIQLSDSYVLNEKENIYPFLVGLSVDYLTRFMMGSPKEKAFEISLRGSFIIDQKKRALSMVYAIRGLSDESIINACKLSGYDVCYRAGTQFYKDVDYIQPDKETISNIRILVNRSISIFKEYGPVIKDGFTFENAYTKIITAGDGDFLTRDTLWDLKVSKFQPKKKDTLQLLIYYLMGKESHQKEFDHINKIGFFIPRLNRIYICNTNRIPEEEVTFVSKYIIEYLKPIIYFID